MEKDLTYDMTSEAMGLTPNALTYEYMDDMPEWIRCTIKYSKWNILYYDSLT